MTQGARGIGPAAAGHIDLEQEFRLDVQRTATSPCRPPRCVSHPPRPATATVPAGAPLSEQALLVHSYPDASVRWSEDDCVPVDMFENVACHVDAGTLLLYCST